MYIATSKQYWSDFGKNDSTTCTLKIPYFKNSDSELHRPGLWEQRSFSEPPGGRTANCFVSQAEQTSPIAKPSMAKATASSKVSKITCRLPDHPGFASADAEKCNSCVLQITFAMVAHILDSAREDTMPVLE